MKTMGVRFGEAFKVKIAPSPQPKAAEQRLVQIGHDGIGFEPSPRIAPDLTFGAPAWRQLERNLDRQAGLVEAFNPQSHQKEAYIVTNGPQEDTFQRVQNLQNRIHEVMNSRESYDSRVALSVMLPMEGLIHGHEPEVTVAQNLGNWSEALQTMRLGQLDSDSPGR